MAVAFVLGNGVSRSSIDLSVLIRYGSVYGCNALYREFAPTVLVATDRPISEQIQQSGYALKHCFYTRNPMLGLGARRIPEAYWKHSSGPAAVGIAAQDQHSKIYLLGFDMGPTKHNQFNNIYADTEFYKASTAPPTYTKNWVAQIQQIATSFGRTEFVRVHGTTTAVVAEFAKNANIHSIDLAQFVEQYPVLKS